MKSRYSLVSNSSTSSFIVNALLYSGVITTPALIGIATYTNQTKIANFFKSFKNKSVINKHVSEKV